MKTVFVLVDGQVVPLKDAVKKSKQQQQMDEFGALSDAEEKHCCVIGKCQEISTDENDLNRHLFMEDSFLFKIKNTKFTAINIHCIIAIVGILCLLSSLGGNFVDDDLVNAPFLELTYNADIIGLRIASLASSFPLFWDLIVDIYNVNYRGSDPAENADRDEYRRAKLVCKKEIWLRMGFIAALSVPSAVLLLSDACQVLTGRTVLPFLSQFVRIIVIFCMSNGFVSELYDTSRIQRVFTLLISMGFVTGILLVFYGRIMMSRAISSSGIGAIIGLCIAGLSTTTFAYRVSMRCGRIFCKEMVSIQNTIQMEEFVFMCYTLGACFCCVTVFCSFFGHNGTMQYDKLSFSGLLTYHILFPLGVLTSVIVSARAVRNWSLEVRYKLVANRLLKLESVIDDELKNRSDFNGIRLESHFQEKDFSMEMMSEIRKKSMNISGERMIRELPLI